MKNILLFIFLFMISINVYADENDTFFMSRTFTDVFAVQEYSSGGKRLYYAKQYLMTKNNITEIGYCIELGANLGATYYSSTSDYNLVGLSDEDARYIKLVAYYGYQYNNHYDYKYYLATQEIIWEYLSGDEIYWVNGESYDASRINVDSMKEEILYLVNRHDIKPDIEYSDISYGDTVTLYDNNNILDEYNVVSASNCNYQKYNDRLVITATNFDDVEISLARNIIKNETDVFFYSDNSQNIMTSGIVDNNLVSYRFNNNGIKLKINKKDYDTKDNIKNSNISFKLFDIDNNEYVNYNNSDIININEDGYIVVDNIYNKRYRLEEVDKDIDNYLYNNNPLEFSIDIDNLVYDNDYGYMYEVDFYNYKPKGSIEINKKGEEFIVDNNNYYYQEVNLSDVYFDIITKQDIIYNGNNYIKDDVILSVKTDDKGIIFVEDLPLGKYIVKEINTSNNYILDDNLYEVNLKYKDPYTNYISSSLVINNYLKKGSIEIVKIDSSNYKYIEGVTFVVYDSNNNIIYKGKTDKDGKIILNNLVYGKYYIKEVLAKDGYMLDDKIYSVVIDDDNINNYIEIANNKIMPPKTGNINLDIILIIFVIICYFSIKHIKSMI